MLLQTKKQRRAKAEILKRELWMWAESVGVSYVEIASYQIRLSDDETRIDIFPQNQRYHDITKNLRGNFTDLIKFVSDHFEK